MKKDIIITKRLSLRVPCLEDATFIQREFPKWEVVQYMSTRIPWPYPDDGAEFFLKEVLLPEIESGNACAFIVELNEGSRFTPIGLVTYEASEDEGVLRRGFWISLGYQGKGYMSEASKVADDWVFQNTDVKALCTENAVSNPKSGNIQVKQGWELVRVEETDKYLGDFSHEQVWLLTREKWEEDKG